MSDCFHTSSENTKLKAEIASLKEENARLNRIFAEIHVDNPDAVNVMIAAMEEQKDFIAQLQSDLAQLKEQLEAQEDTSAIQATLIKGFQEDLAKTREKLAQSQRVIAGMRESLLKIQGGYGCDWKINPTTKTWGCASHDYSDQCEATKALALSTDSKEVKESPRSNYFCKEEGCDGH